MRHFCKMFFQHLFTFAFALVFLFCCVSISAFADSVTDPMSVEEFIRHLFLAIGGMSGATTMGLVLMVVQLAMYFLRTPLANALGVTRLLLVLTLNVVGVVVGLMVSTGMPLLPALLHGTTWAALQVLVAQIAKQFEKVPQDMKAQLLREHQQQVFKR